MLDTNMIAAMRDAIKELLPDTCTILTVTRTADGAGGWSDVIGTASSCVPCRLDMKSGMEQLAGGGLKPYTRYMLSLPYDATISEASRVLHKGETYAVISVNDNQSWQAVTRCELELT